MNFRHGIKAFSLAVCFLTATAYAEDLTINCHDSAKAIKKLATGTHTVTLTGSVNTALLSKIRKAVSANSRSTFALDMSPATGMETIDKEVFAGCTNLTSLVLSDSLVTLHAIAFDGCTALTTFAATEESSAFSALDGTLYSKDGSTLLLCPPALSGAFTLPQQVSSIDSQAFAIAKGCTALLVPEENAAFTAVDGIIYTKDMQTLVRCPRGRTKPVTVPDGVTTIGYGAFSGCTEIESIKLPESVNEIAMLAFENALALRDFTLPAKVIRIGKQAFFGCSSLEHIVIPEATVFIGSRAFYHCKLLSISFESPGNWTNGKKLLKDLADAKENPERFNHPGKYWPNDIYRQIED